MIEDFERLDHDVLILTERVRRQLSEVWFSNLYGTGDKKKQASDNLLLTLEYAKSLVDRIEKEKDKLDYLEEVD